MVNKKITLLIKAIISIGFIAFLISFVQGNELIRLVADIDWFYFILSFVMIPVLLYTSCMKWKVLLDAGGYNLSYLRLIKIYLVGYFFSNLLPSTVGGDVVRSFYAGKEIGTFSYSAVTVFVERLTGLIFLLILVIVAPLVQPALYGSLYFIIPAVLAGLLLLIVFYIFRRKGSLFGSDSLMSNLVSGVENLQNRPGNRFIIRCLGLLGRFLDYIALKLDKFSIELGKALESIRLDKVLFLKIIILTVLFYFLIWVNVYFAFLTFGWQVNFFVMVAFVPTIMFVAQLPVSLLGNLGFFESVFVFYFLMAGIPGEVTLAMGLLLRLKIFCIGGVGFVAYLFYQNTWGTPPVAKT